MQLTYKGSFDAIEIVGHGSVVLQGESFEVEADHGRRLLEQTENYAPADDEAVAALAEILSTAVRVDDAPLPDVTDPAVLDDLTIPQLRKYASDLTPPVDLTGLTRKPEIVAAIAAHEPTHHDSNDETGA